MPRSKPSTSGYARLSQADEEDNLYGDSQDQQDENPYRHPRTISFSSNASYPGAQYAPINGRSAAAAAVGGHAHMPSDASNAAQGRPPSRHHRRRASSGVDIKAINARLERWADEIASKFKIRPIKGKSHEEEKLEIHYSVFQAPEGIRPVTAESLQSEASAGGHWQEGSDKRMTKLEFDEIVESVRNAIELGVQPKMISQGSSGSYFARNAEGKVVGVFKPKDEEPYASRNPKWTKWIHRNLFPCFFGRACLIPNLSYVSEAAAYVLDQRLRTNLVPYTDVVHLSSKVFYYDFWQRSAFYRKRKPLPEKPGSFQVFLQGYKDANLFLRDHPWPDQVNSGFRPQDAPNWRKRAWTDNCKPGSALVQDDEDEYGDAKPSNITSPLPPGAQTPRGQRFGWSETIQQNFREELEKLVILDYIMRNTDRGLDNWMIKVDWQTQEVSITSEPMHLKATSEDHARPVPVSSSSAALSSSKPVDANGHLQEPYRRQEAMTPVSRAGTPSIGGGPRSAGLPPTISVGAIDNSLSWPWKHPDAWRSFPFGWLFLPVSLIGQPFSQKTRDHFLPLLTSTEWWSDTQVALRQIFEQDDDFKERMFARQIAVMKGQAWNVVETLKTPDHGPLELTRRTRVHVWDDVVDIPVAIPLRSSADMRRHEAGGASSSGVAGRDPRGRATAGLGLDEEEMDISTASNALLNGHNHGRAHGKGRSSSRQRDDLMTFAPTPASPPPAAAGDLPNPNRFELSRTGSSSDIHNHNLNLGAGSSSNPFASSEPSSPSPLHAAEALSQNTEARDFAAVKGLRASRPAPIRTRSRLSFEGRATAGSGHRKRGSWLGGGTGQSRRTASYSNRYDALGGALYDGVDGDLDEGDLGYAAARSTEKNTRKVIVERLETVKSRPPVFTWC